MRIAFRQDGTLVVAEFVKVYATETSSDIGEVWGIMSGCTQAILIHKCHSLSMAEITVLGIMHEQEYYNLSD